MARYKITRYTQDEDEEASWDADDWCFLITAQDDDDDIVCICATEGEAQHIQALLEEHPYLAATASD